MALGLSESRVHGLVSACTQAPKWRILTLAGSLIRAIAVSDYPIGLNISLGALYAIPMILVGLALPPRPLVGVALMCAIFRDQL